ncbi:zinc finger matrin-type protein 3 [Aplochiton taeniatus]
MMALHVKNGDAYYQSADYCRNYSTQAMNYGVSSHYFARLPGPEAVFKPPFSLFSQPHHQPFQPMAPAHQLGPPPMAPTHHIGPPPMAPSTQVLGPPPLAPTHRLGPPPMGPTKALGPPPVDPSQALGPPPMDLTHPLGPPPMDSIHPLGPPPGVVRAQDCLRFPLPCQLSSQPPPPALASSPLQLVPRPRCPAPDPGQVSGLLPAQVAPGSTQQPQDEDSQLGEEEQEASLSLEELCKPLYCKLCNVTLNSAQQAQAHYQGKNHSKKLRNFYAGSQQPPPIRIPEVLEAGSQTPSNTTPTESAASTQAALYKGLTRVILATENDYCKLCDASFSSLAVAQAHYQGKNHAKRLRLAEAQNNPATLECSESSQRRPQKDRSEYRLVKNRRTPQVPAAMPGPYYNPRSRQRIPRDLAMCVTPSGQFYCSMCNSGAGEEQDFRVHLESKQHKSKVSELRYRNEMENLGYS